MGYAFAGGAASAEDASTIFWNPAGMTRLPGRQAVVGLNAIYWSARFRKEGTTSPAGPAFPITGGDGGNPVGLNWVPNLYYAADLGRDLKGGIGINSPFGLKTEYPADWMGRYHAIDSVLKSLNINPSIAWKARDGSEFGDLPGVSVKEVKAMLESGKAAAVCRCAAQALRVTHAGHHRRSDVAGPRTRAGVDGRTLQVRTGARVLRLRVPRGPQDRHRATRGGVFDARYMKGGHSGWEGARRSDPGAWLAPHYTNSTIELARSTPMATLKARWRFGDLRSLRTPTPKPSQTKPQSSATKKKIPAIHSAWINAPPPACR